MAISADGSALTSGEGTGARLPAAETLHGSSIQRRYSRVATERSPPISVAIPSEYGTDNPDAHHPGPLAQTKPGVVAPLLPQPQKEN